MRYEILWFLRHNKSIPTNEKNIYITKHSKPYIHFIHISQQDKKIFIKLFHIFGFQSVLSYYYRENVTVELSYTLTMWDLKAHKGVYSSQYPFFYMDEYALLRIVYSVLQYPWKLDNSFFVFTVRLDLRQPKISKCKFLEFFVVVACFIWYERILLLFFCFAFSSYLLPNKSFDPVIEEIGLREILLPVISLYRTLWPQARI